MLHNCGYQTQFVHAGNIKLPETTNVNEITYPTAACDIVEVSTEKIQIMIAYISAICDIC